MIPAEAVEAAAKKLWRRGRVDPWEDARDYIAAEFREDARTALEAAAPHMAAAAWDEGYQECYERQMYEPVPTNPYRTAK